MVGIYIWTTFIIFVLGTCSFILNHTSQDRYFRNVYDGSIWQVVDVIKKKNEKYYILQNVTTFDRQTVLKKNLKSKFD